MKYFRLIILKKDNKILFSDILEGIMDHTIFEQSKFDKPITRVPSDEGIHFIAFEKNYLEAMLAGIAVSKELYVTQSITN